MTDSEDDPLVARAKNGDPDAWRELYRAHAGRLGAWLRTRPTGDASVSADDVAGEAWLVAATKVADFHGSTSDFGGWLFTIARNVTLTTHRRSDRRKTEPTEPHDHVVSVPDATVEIDRQEWLRHLLSTLPPRERDVIGLIDGLGFDNRTAGEVLGISQVAVRTARHRGLRRLERARSAQA